MMRQSNFFAGVLLCVGGLALGAGCGHAPPPALVNARQAYQRASRGPAAQLAPTELYKASQTLNLAESNFSREKESPKTLDLSYISERQSEYAEAMAGYQASERAREKAERDFVSRQGQMVKQTQGELTKTREQLAQESMQLGSERQGRLDAEKRASEAEQQARDALSKLAAVKQEERGMVITLSGSVLFASDKSELLPAAQTRLDQVAAALLSTKDRSIMVEGYTDSRGSDSHNLDLSQRRADSVRQYLVSRGYPTDKIQARGMGKDNPVADNGSAEGRANNRRVEIVVRPKGAGSAQTGAADRPRASGLRSPNDQRPLLHGPS